MFTLLAPAAFLQHSKVSSSGFETLPQFCLSQVFFFFFLFLHDGGIRSLGGALAIVRLFVYTKSHWIIKINSRRNVWKLETDISYWCTTAKSFKSLKTYFVQQSAICWTKHIGWLTQLLIMFLSCSLYYLRPSLLEEQWSKLASNRWCAYATRLC